MKENPSNKSNNRRITFWIDKLLPFDFHIEQMPGAKMRRADYIQRHQIQKAAVNKKYDCEIVVAIIFRIHDAIESLYSSDTHTSHSCTSKQLKLEAWKLI